MAISLQDVRTAVTTYVKNNVMIYITGKNQASKPTPDIPNALSPGEEFTYELHVTNNGPIPLINVIYHLRIEPSNRARLKVPVGLQCRKTPKRTDPLLSANELVKEMYVFANDSTLDGNDDDWFTLKGKADTLGQGEIQGNVLAEVDVASLFRTDLTHHAYDTQPFEVV